MSQPNLFSPLEIRGVTLKNRIVISPMWQYMAERGNPTDHHLSHYGALAAGGAGLVMQEGTSVDERSRGTLGDLGLWNDDQIPALRRIVELMKSYGAVPGIQLIHPGRKVKERPPWDWSELGSQLTAEEMSDFSPEIWDRIAPSAVPQALYPDVPVARAMSLDDIREAQDAFVAAAVRADQAGYEVIELHAAHGYLLHIFLSEATNQRTDHYGGSFENRIRFLCEIVERIRAEISAEKPFLVRLSSLDGSAWTIQDTVALSKQLKDLGVDMIDCSSGGIQKDVGMDRRSEYGYLSSLAATVRKEAGVMTNAVGLIVHAHHANQIIEEGRADTVSIAREAIYNPNWPIDAAHKLGLDPDFSLVPKNLGFWLKYRQRGMEGFLPSTHDIDRIPPIS